MPFFSMFGSTNPTPLIAQGMEEVNPIILGCDTYPTYSALIREGRVRATYSTSRKTAVFVLQQVAKVSRLLAQDNTTIDLSKVGPQKVIQPVLHSLLRISKNYFLEFPDKKNQELKSEE